MATRFVLKVLLEEEDLEAHARDLVENGWAERYSPSEVKIALEAWLEDCVWKLAKEASGIVTDRHGFNAEAFERILGRGRVLPGVVFTP